MAFSATIPTNDELLTNFPALCRANWDGIVLGTDANLLITNAKIAAGAGIVDTKLAQITTASKVHGTAITGLASLPAGAGVVPDANSNGKMKADASDTTPQYLDSLLDTGVFQISAGDLLQLKDGGVETVKLVNGSASPGNSKYYGTDSGGTKGFFSLPAITDYTADAATDVSGKSWVLDEDNMASDSATKLATQQSIKYYVDNKAIGDTSVSQAKLKTTTGEVSQSGGGSGIKIMAGGSYGFYPQLKIASNQGSGYEASIYYVVATRPSTNYTTYIFLLSPSGGAIFYAQQRYVTASGRDHWIFLLIDKVTKKMVGGYQAPDHPCYGNGGDEVQVSHPFGSYDQTKHEIVIVDNSILTELKPLITRKNSLLTLINSACLIEDSKRPKYQPREIIEIDEFGDMKGEVIKVGKTPDWAKIKIMKDEYELKRRMVETLPNNILYKKLRLK